METPTLIVNLKTYEAGSGKQAIQLAYTCEKVATQEDVSVAVAVQNADLARITPKVDIPVLAQHIDPHGHGSNTGKDIAETLAFNGATGVLINHAEDQVPIEDIETAVDRAHDAGLETVVCIDRPEMADEISAFRPDFIAYEPAELIGGDTSVTDSQPELIENAVNAASVPVLCGAGVKTDSDARQALDRGTVGVLVASGVVKADDPETALRNLVASFDR